MASFVGSASSSFCQLDQATSAHEKMDMLGNAGRLQWQVLVPQRPAAPPVVFELADELVVRGRDVVLDSDARFSLQSDVSSVMRSQELTFSTSRAPRAIPSSLRRQHAAGLGKQLSELQRRARLGILSSPG